MTLDYIKDTGEHPLSAHDLTRVQFSQWMKKQFASIPPGQPLLLYLSSHQDKTGDWRFKDGIMNLDQIAQILKDSIGKHPCLIINDSCHAASWGKIPWPRNFQFIFVSSAGELNREINLWNDSPALARTYSKQIEELQNRGQGTEMSYFGVLWLAIPQPQIAFNSREWSVFFNELKSQDSLLRKRVSRINFPVLLIR